VKRRKPLPAKDKLSKSHLKRESRSLQKLGEALVDLSPEDLEPLDLPERLVEALNDARGIKKHEALRRQRQYIGRLMREIDAEPVRRFLETRRSAAQEDNRHFHAAEDWRRRLLEGGQSMVPACAEATGADPGELSDGLAAVLQAPNEPLRRAASRNLFRLLYRSIDPEPATSADKAQHVPGRPRH
jgi:ribosome-associated protein